MNKISLYLLLIVASLCSCGSNNVKEQYYDLGKSKNYTKFLWKEANWNEDLLPVQTLQLNVGKLGFSKPVELEVVYSEKSQNNYKPVNTPNSRIMTIIKDGNPLEGSSFTIYPSDTTVQLKFRFNEEILTKDSTTSARYKISLRIINPGDLDLINGQVAEAGTVLDTDVKWQVKYEKVWNPLGTALFWTGICLAALLVLWFAVLQWIVFPRFAFDNLQVTYMEGESRKGREDCSLHGARKIICSANPKSQSGLNRLFSGRIEYLTNPFWETPVVMTPCGSSGIAVSEEMKAGSASNYRMSAMITPQNGPRRPFVVKRTKSEMTANISIG